MRTSVILLLVNVNLFRSKLAQSPLASCFPDYTSGNDVNRAVKYILWRSSQVNRAHLNLYPQFVTDGTNMRLVFAAIKEALVWSDLRDRGFL
jgi:guanine nucleotide-binding protein G(i) subunit alpha